MMASVLGERLLPSLVDEIALSDPHRVLYSVAKTKNLKDGFDDIDVKSFARAVDRFSWYIDEHLGKGQGFPTLAYIGPQDILYAISVLACIKTGYKLLLISTRNTLESNLSLFEKTDCGTLICPTNFPLPIVKQILTAKPMRYLEVPAVNHWLDGQLEGKPYPYTKTFAEAKAEPFVVLHTSGSTGLPKPIIQTHATISPFDAFTALPSLGYQPTYPAMCAGKRVYLSFPLFHCGGITMLLPASIFAGFTIVLGPFPPSVNVINGVHVYGNVDQSCLVPTMLIDLANNPEYLQNLGRLELIAYGGGPCPKVVAELISTKTKLLTSFGSTESSVFPAQLCDPEDSAYVSLSKVLGYEYRPFSGDLYEQVIVRNQALEKYQGVFGTFPELNEWNMKDLFLKHPTKEDLWLYKGRADDIIVFSNGEKLNPLDMESIIGMNPIVRAVLVTGLGRFQASLLIEAVHPPTSDVEKEELLKFLWPSVQEANKEAPSHGRIHRNMIAFTSPEKPMLRAGKGTVQRMFTVDAYASEIDALYGASKLPDGETMNIAIENNSGVEDAIRNILTSSTDIDIDSLSPTADLFELGLDSLQVMVIARELNKYLSLRGKTESLEIKNVYSNSSISALTAVISVLVEGRTISRDGETDAQKMQKLYELHAANMPISGRQAQPQPSDGLVFLLTGSTGSLGSYVLDSLHNDSRVRRIYCLNRGPNSLQRQKKSQSAKDLQPLSDKVQCLDADLSKSYFGLSIQEYRELINQVTHIIHNAWQVDFNLSIDSFANHISVVRRLVDFSSHSRFGAHLFFVSSISATGGLKGVVAEQIFENWHTPGETGYGKSKFVSERLLDTAAKISGISTVACRVGQVAGPTSASGMWPKREWLPSLIASSKYLGKLPSSLGRMETVDWIPVDILGESIVELAIHSPSTPEAGATVYHAVNPQRTSWAGLVATVAQHLALKTVAWDEWIKALRESASKTEDLAENPAVKILEFFESLTRVSEDDESILLDTRETIRVSQTLANLGPVHDGWMQNWMRQWSF
ncbi:uncharacterized protein GGS22DRAFT_194569 [Annulohypoxylon maeteangense]|uniref:uncharacterized protein n=1 Tax=Annulohypoxylon maeteangense TaxID=1927788 RepID=UPI0020085D37|nr:uncharacterized protein GGS22DRAFT_194569 [Annulohypoxylon maeteangense]KAI0890636.1 hypothetical protein GGS22DRAFT_194569 [Annulohypoxylon maeteangense]